MANYSFKTTGLPEPINGVVEGHNLAQAVPHTAIYAGQLGLTFRKCNLMNCDVPQGSILDDCNTGHTSYCSHVHPKLLTLGILSACVANCSHVITTDTITIDGQLVDTVYTYEDKAV